MKKRYEETNLSVKKAKSILKEATAAFLLTLKILHNDDSNNLSRQKSKKDVIGIVTRCNTILLRSA